MLFSSPDYPVFLIAVFFLYALARWSGGTRGSWARIAVMVLLADVVFLLVAKDPDALWDPIGGALLRLVAGDGRGWPPWLFAKWAVGLGVGIAGVQLGRRRADWLSSAAGQRQLALGFAMALGVVGALVGAAWGYGLLAPVTAGFGAVAHLGVLALLAVGLGASAAAPQRALGRVSVLFVASSLFYHAWAAAMPGVYRYLLGVLLATIVLDYYLALWIEATTHRGRRKALLIVSLCSNLGVLVFFKYADFFAHDVLQLGGARWDLILPAGISFHTFQSLSYTIDVYRKELPATRSVVEFATFVLFFPQLVAGPIVRAQDLLPQLAAPPPLELSRATAGLFRIVVGLFKKIALADTLALLLVDRVFEAPERYSSVEVLAGVYGYALQIYLDFSAYSDIAIGSAMILGFTLPENFRTPYRAADLQEFWRRWHISLSTWLRDYLYVPLGGNRRGPRRTYFNLLATMVLGGLWHGASWAFVVWGALHGGGLAVTRAFQRRGPRVALGCVAWAVLGAGVHRVALADAGAWWQLAWAWCYATPLWAVVTAWLARGAPAAARPGHVVPRPRLASWLRAAMCAVGAGVFVALWRGAPASWFAAIAAVWLLAAAADLVARGTLRGAAIAARRTLAGVLVFHYVCLAWIFFRAPTFADALAVLRSLAAGTVDHPNLVPVVACALFAGAACHLFPDGSFRWLRERFVALPPWAQGALLGGAALVLRELGHPKLVPFIYFQF